MSDVCVKKNVSVEVVKQNVDLNNDGTPDKVVKTTVTTEKVNESQKGQDGVECRPEGFRIKDDRAQKVVTYRAVYGIPGTKKFNDDGRNWITNSKLSFENSSGERIKVGDTVTYDGKEYVVLRFHAKIFYEDPSAKKPEAFREGVYLELRGRYNGKGGYEPVSTTNFKPEHDSGFTVGIDDIKAVK